MVLQFVLVTGVYGSSDKSLCSVGEVEYIVTEKSLRQRLNTDMKSAVLSIPENFR